MPNSTLKARYDLNCVESAVKHQPTNQRDRLETHSLKVSVFLVSCIGYAMSVTDKLHNRNSYISRKIEPISQYFETRIPNPEPTSKNH